MDADQRPNDLLVFQSLQPLIAQVNGIVPLSAEESHGTARQTHVGEQLHAGTPTGM